MFEWEEDRESSFLYFGDRSMRERLRLALNFWRVAGCELCTAYHDYTAADTHDMEQCRNWEDAPKAQRILRLLEEMSVRARPDERRQNTTGSPCKACSFPSERCQSDSPRLTARDGTVADCVHIEVARRAVAALLSFEDGLLVDVLPKAAWVMTDDPAAMQAWMAEQKLTDLSYYSVPGILRALDELYGSYGNLFAEHEYRAELHPLAKKKDAAQALPPRCSDEPVGVFIEAMDAELLAKEQRLNVLEELIQETKDTAIRLWDSRCTAKKQWRWPYQGFEEGYNKWFVLDSEYQPLNSYINAIRDMMPICLRLKEIEPRLLRFRDACMICRAMGKPSDHSIRVCTNEMAHKVCAELTQVGRVVNFDLRLGCHRCGMPKLICSRWTKQKGEVNFRLMRVSGRCNFEDVALETIYSIKYGYKAIWDAWISRLDQKDIDRENEDWICEYLGSEKYSELRWESLNPSSNLLWEFEWMTQLIEGESSSR